jgi:hypothetical protein
MYAPATNAVLTAVSGPGTIDRYGDVSGTTSLWAGSVSGYLKRARSARTGSDREEDTKQDTFVIQGAAASPVLLSLSSGADSEAVRVTITDRRFSPAVVNTYKIKGLEILAAGTVADSVRLTLKREEVA